MADSWNKKEREKRKKQSKKEKAEKKLERKESKNADFDSMVAYVDENGNLSSTPPDPNKKFTVNAEDIVVGVPKQEDAGPEELIHSGVVTFFNHGKGYGFIKDEQTNESVFVHANSLSEPIEENSRVLFEVEKSPKGLNAVNVRPDK